MPARIPLLQSLLSLGNEDQEDLMRPEDIEGLTVGGLLDLVTERRPDDDALV